MIPEAPVATSIAPLIPSKTVTIHLGVPRVQQLVMNSYARLAQTMLSGVPGLHLHRPRRLLILEAPVATSTAQGLLSKTATIHPGELRAPKPTTKQRARLAQMMRSGVLGLHPRQPLRLLILEALDAIITASGLLCKIATIHLGELHAPKPTTKRRARRVQMVRNGVLGLRPRRPHHHLALALQDRAKQRWWATGSGLGMCRACRTMQISRWPSAVGPTSR